MGCCHSTASTTSGSPANGGGTPPAGTHHIQGNLSRTGARGQRGPADDTDALDTNPLAPPAAAAAAAEGSVSDHDHPSEGHPVDDVVTLPRRRQNDSGRDQARAMVARAPGPGNQASPHLSSADHRPQSTRDDNDLEPRVGRLPTVERRRTAAGAARAAADTDRAATATSDGSQKADHDSLTSPTTPDFAGRRGWDADVSGRSSSHLRHTPTGHRSRGGRSSANGGRGSRGESPRFSSHRSSPLHSPARPSATVTPPLDRSFGRDRQVSPSKLLAGSFGGAADAPVPGGAGGSVLTGSTHSAGTAGGTPKKTRSAFHVLHQGRSSPHALRGSDALQQHNLDAFFERVAESHSLGSTPKLGPTSHSGPQSTASATGTHPPLAPEPLPAALLPCSQDDGAGSPSLPGTAPRSDSERSPRLAPDGESRSGPGFMNNNTTKANSPPRPTPVAASSPLKSSSSSGGGNNRPPAEHHHPAQPPSPAEMRPRTNSHGAVSFRATTSDEMRVDLGGSSVYSASGRADFPNLAARFSLSGQSTDDSQYRSNSRAPRGSMSTSHDDRPPRSPSAFGRPPGGRRWSASGAGLPRPQDDDARKDSSPTESARVGADGRPPRRGTERA